MTKLFSIVILLYLPLISNGQGEIKVGSNQNPTNLIMDTGTLVVGTQNDSIAGAIKFENGAFYGFDGNRWLALSPVEKEIIGLSTMTTNGRMQFNGKTGIEAANEMCKTSYPDEPTARYYFQHDIDEALALDNVSNITDGEFFWSFKHGFDGFSSNAFDSRANNCWCFSFNSGDFANGTRGAIYLNQTTPGNGGGIIANQVRYQPNISCGNTFKVICGR